VSLAQAAHLAPEVRPCLGRGAFLAKQLAIRAGGCLVCRTLSYPLQVALTLLDPVISGDLSRRSFAYLLIAPAPRAEHAP
jgi:hypothetical protein